MSEKFLEKKNEAMKRVGLVLHESVSDLMCNSGRSAKLKEIMAKINLKSNYSVKIRVAFSDLEDSNVIHGYADYPDANGREYEFFLGTHKISPGQDGTFEIPLLVDDGSGKEKEYLLKFNGIKKE